MASMERLIAIGLGGGPKGKADKAATKRPRRSIPEEAMANDLSSDEDSDYDDGMEYGVDDHDEPDEDDEGGPSDYDEDNDYGPDSADITPERIDCARDLERAVNARDYRGIVEAVLAIVGK